MLNFIFILIVLNSVSFSEINTLSCMYYSNCNSSLIGTYNTTSPCWQNIYSRSPSLVSQQCTSNSQTSAFCFAYSYSYTNYLTNSLVGYLNFNQGCLYLPTVNLNYYLNISNSATSYNYSSVIPGTNLPLTLELKYLLCNTSDCNSQYAGSCISAELVQTILSSNLTSVGNLTSLPVYQSCSSGSSSSLPTFKLTITLGLKVNQVFISDYNNLNSAASLSFIQNFTNFMSTALNNNQPTSVVVISLTSGSVVVNSMLVYNSSTLSSTSMTSILTSSIQTAAASSSSFPVIANSLSVTVTSSVANGTLKMNAYASHLIFLIFAFYFLFLA